MLFLEGEAPDRSNGGVMLVDGLKLTTDLDHMAMVPTPGWAAHIDQAGAVTVEWPHHRPLLADAPLGLPDGWLRAAMEHGVVLLFAGYGLGLHEHAGNGPAHPVERLLGVAESGALAAGTVLSAVNQGAVLADGQATVGTWLRIAINYLVPFLVASVGYLSARRAREISASGAARVVKP